MKRKISPIVLFDEPRHSTYDFFWCKPNGVFLFDEGWFQYVRSDSERIFS